MGIRRELTKALQKVDKAAAGLPLEDLASGIKIQTIQTGIFAAALRVVEYYHKPGLQPEVPTLDPTDPATSSSATLPDISNRETLTHTLSEAAHDAAVKHKTAHALTPLLSGPLVLLTFPTVSPQHMKAALSILSPSPPEYPAPTRKANQGWHDLTVQSGIQKLLLLGARVEGRVFDVDGAKWVGSIEGGLDGLRAQLVAMLQGAGAGITNTLESAAKNLYFTVESRRTMLDEGNGVSADDSKEAAKAE